MLRNPYLFIYKIWPFIDAYFVYNKVNAVNESVAQNSSNQKMLVLSQAPGGALSARRCSLRSSPALTNPNSPLFSNRKSKFVSTINPKKSFPLTLAKADQGVDSNSSSATTTTTTNKQSIPTSSNSPAFNNDQTVLVGQENVPLEGVIQFEKPNSSSRFKKWG